MNVPDLFWKLRNNFFWLKILNIFYADPDPGSFDPGSGMEKFRIRDPQHCIQLFNAGVEQEQEVSESQLVYLYYLRQSIIQTVRIMQLNSAGISSLPIGIFAKPYSPLFYNLVLQLKVPTFTAKYRTSRSGKKSASYWIVIDWIRIRAFDQWIRIRLRILIGIQPKMLDPDLDQMNGESPTLKKTIFFSKFFCLLFF